MSEPRRRWRIHRTAVFLAALGVAWLVSSTYLSAAARHKMDAALLSALDRAQPVDVWVKLPFPPEEFHIRYLQDQGTVTGVRGRWIHLMRVRPDAAWGIARLYWVQRVTGETEPQGVDRERGVEATTSARRSAVAFLPF